MVSLRGTRNDREMAVRSEMKMIIAGIAACGEDGPGLIGQYGIRNCKSAESTSTFIHDSRLYAKHVKSISTRTEKGLMFLILVLLH